MNVRKGEELIYRKSWPRVPMMGTMITRRSRGTSAPSWRSPWWEDEVSFVGVREAYGEFRQNQMFIIPDCEGPSTSWLGDSRMGQREAEAANMAPRDWTL